MKPQLVAQWKQSLERLRRLCCSAGFNLRGETLKRALSLWHCFLIQTTTSHKTSGPISAFLLLPSPGNEYEHVCLIVCVMSVNIFTLIRIWYSRKPLENFLVSGFLSTFDYFQYLLIVWMFCLQRAKSSENVFHKHKLTSLNCFFLVWPTVQNKIYWLYNYMKQKFKNKRYIPVYFWLFTMSRDLPYLLQMLLKFDHVYTLVDLRLHLLPFMLKQEMETL